MSCGCELDPCGCSSDDSLGSVVESALEGAGKIAGGVVGFAGDFLGASPSDTDIDPDRRVTRKVQNVVFKNWGETGTDISRQVGTDGDVFQAIAIHPKSEVSDILILPGNQQFTETLDVTEMLAVSVDAPLIQPVKGPFSILSPQTTKDSFGGNDLVKARLGLSLYRYVPESIPVRRPPVRWVGEYTIIDDQINSIPWVRNGEFGPDNQNVNIPAYGRKQMEIAINVPNDDDATTITTTIYGITYWGAVAFKETLVERADTTEFTATYKSDNYFDAYEVTVEATLFALVNTVKAVVTLRDG